MIHPMLKLKPTAACLKYTLNRCLQNRQFYVFVKRRRLFARGRTSPLLSSHNGAGLSRVGSNVGTEWAGVNQVAAREKSSFHGRVNVSHSVSNTGASHHSW